MNSKERVRQAFRHCEADRVPTFELTVDNPTARHVLGRSTLCGFGGRVRGLAQNKALMAGSYESYHRQRIADEIALWQALDLDVYPNAYPLPRNPAVPEQIADNVWRFTDPDTEQWSLCWYMPESETYDEVDSSIRVGGLSELERLTANLEATPPKYAELHRLRQPAYHIQPR